jgi:hypothetical protein
MAHPSLTDVGLSQEERLGYVARGAAWLLAGGAALRLVDVLIAHNPLLATVTGAIVVDLAGSHVGDGRPPPQPRSITTSAKFAGQGAQWGLAVFAATFGASLAFGWATTRFSASIATASLGLLRAIAAATRDELLYRGIVRSFGERARLRPAMLVAYTALAGFAPAILIPGASSGSIAVAGASSLALSLLWERGEGATPAIAAHAAWRFMAGAAIHGGLAETTFTMGDLGEGARIAAAPAWFAAAAWTAAVALLVQRRREAARRAARAPTTA